MQLQGELCIVISRTGKNISEDEAADYIAGFTAGNDVSSRYWQRQPYSGGQFSYAKSFDTFAPLGPTLLHPSAGFQPAREIVASYQHTRKRQNEAIVFYGLYAFQRK